VASGTAIELSDVEALHSAQPQVSVVVPAYNEAEGLERDLASILETMASQEAAYEVIVVDDGSEDDTARIAAEIDGVRLVRHQRNRGYGAALKTGIRHARGEYIVITDADGTYPSKYIPVLLERMEHADMAVGARIGEDVKIPALRRPAKWLLNRVASMMTDADIPDLNSGLRVFRKDAALRFISLLPSGFSFTSTITLAMLCNEMVVDYTPIDYRERTGSSKINPIRDTYNFFLLVFRIVCYFNPLKIFMPPALLLVALGSGKLIYDIIAENNIFQGEMLAILMGLQLSGFGLLADAFSKLRAATTETPTS